MIPNIPDENKLIGIRKYLQEFVIVSLSAAVIYLFKLHNNMADKVFQTAIETRVVIEKNTRALEILTRNLPLNENRNNRNNPDAN